MPSRAATPDSAGTGIAWVGPRECAAAPELAARVEEIAGERGRAIDADVEVTRGAARLEVRVRVRHASGGEGQRAFSARTCALAIEGAAAILALSAVRGDAPESESSTSTSTITTTTTTTPTPTDSHVVPVPVPVPVLSERAPPGEAPPRSTTRLSLGALLLGDAGSIPGAGVGAGIAIGFRPFARARLEAEGAAWLDRSVDLAGAPGIGGRFSMTTASARGCYAVLARRLELSPCFGASMARIEASGFGAEVTRTSDGVFVAPSFGGLAYFRIAGAFGVRLLVEGLVPLSRPSFVIVRGGTVDRASAIVARASIGPEVSF